MMERINPPTLIPPAGDCYTQVVTTTATKSIHISGQVALDKEGNVVYPGDVVGQMKEALENLRLALQAAGVTPQDLVRIRYYVVDYDADKAAEMIEVINEFFEGKSPASTLLGVSALFVPGLLIEIDGTAEVR